MEEMGKAMNTPHVKGDHFAEAPPAAFGSA
jgi:hypothetical protein